MTASDIRFVTLSHVPVKAERFHLFGNRLISVTNRNYFLLTPPWGRPVKRKMQIWQGRNKDTICSACVQNHLEATSVPGDAGDQEFVCCCFPQLHKVSDSGAQDRGKGYYVINISSLFHHQLIITVVCVLLYCCGNQCLLWIPRNWRTESIELLDFSQRKRRTKFKGKYQTEVERRKKKIQTNLLLAIFVDQRYCGQRGDCWELKEYISIYYDFKLWPQVSKFTDVGVITRLLLLFRN